VIKNKKDGVFNATAPLPVNQRNLVKSIAKTLGVPQWMPGIPQFPIRLIMGAMSSVLFESLRVSSKRLSDQGFEFSFQDIDSCLKDLLR
jgi:NAD dependent epimerase/dehydratase family enzyme